MDPLALSFAPLDVTSELYANDAVDPLYVNYAEPLPYVMAMSLVGGGIKGLMELRYCAAIERVTGMRIPELFNIMGGVSTGGIATLLLCDGMKAEDAIEFYTKEGPKIFSRGIFRRVTTLMGTVSTFYTHAVIERELKNLLGDRTMKQCATRAMISTLNKTKIDPVFFKSWDTRYNDAPMWQVAMATSSAQVYFPSTVMQVANEHMKLIDGGNCDNNPAMSVYAECQRLWGRHADVVSTVIGCGQPDPSITWDISDGGALFWAPNIFTVMSAADDKVTNYNLSSFYMKETPTHFYRFINPVVPDLPPMDDARPKTMQRLIDLVDNHLDTHAEQFTKFCAHLKLLALSQ